MLFFDDIDVGYRSRIGTYTLERDEIIEFARQWDPQPFHIDERAAKESAFGGLVASSLHLFAICTRLFFDHEDHIGDPGKLVGRQLPARVGDTLTYWTECVDRKPSRSKPDRGVITLADTLANQQGDTVLSQRVSLLVRRRTT